MGAILFCVMMFVFATSGAFLLCLGLRDRVWWQVAQGVLLVLYVPVRVAEVIGWL